jgi:hypothetical protein
MTAYGIQLGAGVSVNSGVTLGSTGGGGGGGGSAVVKLDISGISGTNVPDLSGNSHDGTLYYTYNTGTDGHGSYVHLTGNHLVGSGYIGISSYNLTTPFTIRMIIALDNSQTYWASLWGNESYLSNKGYIAYLNSATNLIAGPMGGFTTVNPTGITSISQWDFVIDGSSSKIYKNGSQVSSNTYSGKPTGGNSTNGLYVGSRHANNGTGSTDLCQMKVYSFEVFDSALSGSTISTDFATNQSIFNI